MEGKNKTNLLMLTKKIQSTSWRLLRRLLLRLRLRRRLRRRLRGGGLSAQPRLPAAACRRLPAGGCLPAAACQRLPASGCQRLICVGISVFAIHAVSYRLLDPGHKHVLNSPEGISPDAATTGVTEGSLAHVGVRCHDDHRVHKEPLCVQGLWGHFEPFWGCLCMAVGAFGGGG